MVLKKCRPDRDIMTPEIKAARQQGRNVARKYLQKDKLAILVVGNDCEFDKPLSIVGAVTNVDITLPHRPRN